MRYKLARMLQLIGLLVAPAGIAGNLARPEQVTVKATLAIGLGGLGLFFLGWLLQQGARP